MVLMPSKPLGKVTEKHPIETNPALQLVWRTSSCSAVAFGTGVDEAQLSSAGVRTLGLFLPFVPLILLSFLLGHPVLG